MLGRAKGAAIKLDPDENIAYGLHIGEGLETCLAARLAGFRPVWALGSAGAIATFPVLSGIKAITVLMENDATGTNARAAQQCAAQWRAAGCEVIGVEPLVGKDLNDVWRATYEVREKFVLGTLCIEDDLAEFTRGWR
jgi:hypothetical protein